MTGVSYSYRFGSAEFDEARFELKVAGLPVDVERRALEVLAYLLRHAGEVVTKEELLREVWAGRITVDKVLPNAVNKLRRALGEANAEHIVTQARLGYRLDGIVTRTAVGRQLASTLQLSIGHPVPGRGNFVLQRQLGHTAGNEVWLAIHSKTRETRVYKFALDGERLRALKREATLLRVLQDSLPESQQFVEIIDWNFELSPYFLELSYGGETLGNWAANHLAMLDTPARINLFLKIADAVAAAHALGVLHKDLKPDNVLVMDVPGGDPQVRITDFGSGQLLEPDRLEQLGITRMGMTVDDQAGLEATSGTPLYLAPELFSGQAPTVQSDVFALGILLYQLLANRLGQPMVSGWEADIGDELLREDLQRATEGNPLRRLSSATELAQRLRQLEPRRQELLERRSALAEARRDRAALVRAQARRPMLVVLILVLLASVAVALWLRQQAVSARDQAQRELQRATALARFLNEDLISRSNPLVSAKGAETTLREVLLSARERIGTRFAAQPQTEAAVRASLASLFNSIDQFAEAEAEARQALKLEEAHSGAGSATALQLRAVLVRVLSRLSQFDEAQALLKEFEQLSGPSPNPAALQQLAAMRSTLHMARGEFEQAAASLQLAIAGLDPRDASLGPQRDALRLDLIAALTSAGQAQQARQQGEALLGEFQRRGTGSELLVALTQLTLARAQGEDHAAAEQLLRSAQPVIVQQLGENHIRHLQLLGELLGVAFRRGDWPRAVAAAQQLHERLRDKFGDQHVLTWVSLTNWGRTLGEAGQPQAAVDKLRLAHEHLTRLVGRDAPQTQDTAFVLALSQLQLREVSAAEQLIAVLDPGVLESGRATGQWPAAIDALRGIALAQRGEHAAARTLLDSALTALATEADLDAPGLLYQTASQARAALP